jgi:hypothetical protein
VGHHRRDDLGPGRPDLAGGAVTPADAGPHHRRAGDADDRRWCATLIDASHLRMVDGRCVSSSAARQEATVGGSAGSGSSWRSAHQARNRRRSRHTPPGRRRPGFLGQPSCPVLELVEFGGGGRRCDSLDQLATGALGPVLAHSPTPFLTSEKRRLSEVRSVGGGSPVASHEGSQPRLKTPTSRPRLLPPQPDRSPGRSCPPPTAGVVHTADPSDLRTIPCRRWHDGRESTARRIRMGWPMWSARCLAFADPC